MPSEDKSWLNHIWRWCEAFLFPRRLASGPWKVWTWRRGQKQDAVNGPWFLPGLFSSPWSCPCHLSTLWGWTISVPSVVSAGCTHPWNWEGVFYGSQLTELPHWISHVYTWWLWLLSTLGNGLPRNANNMLGGYYARLSLFIKGTLQHSFLMKLGHLETFHMPRKNPVRNWGR